MNLVISSLPKPPSWGRGWGQYNVTCQTCGAEFQAVAPVGDRGGDCPYCGYHDETLEWVPMPDEPANDGAWLSGRIDGDW